MTNARPVSDRRRAAARRRARGRRRRATSRAVERPRARRGRSPSRLATTSTSLAATDRAAPSTTSARSATTVVPAVDGCVERRATRAGRSARRASSTPTSWSPTNSEARSAPRHPGDHVVHSPVVRVEQVGVDPAPPDEHLDQQVAAVGRRLRRRATTRASGSRSNTTGSSRRVGAERVEADVPVVLVVLRIAGVPEAGAVGQPGDRRGAGVGDRVGETLAGVDVAGRAARCSRCHPRSARRRRACRRATGGTSRSPSRASAASVAGSSSVRGGTAGSTAERSDERRTGRRRPARSSTNSWSPRTVQRQHRRQRDERGEALVPPRPGRAGHRAPRGCAGSARPPSRRPRRTSPSSSHRYGSATLDAVVDVDDVAHAVCGGGAERRCQPRPMLGRLPWLALLTAQLRLALLGLLRHRLTSLPALSRRAEPTRAGRRPTRC